MGYCYNNSTYPTIKRINEHSRDSDAAVVEAEIAETKIKIRPQQTLEPTSIILNDWEFLSMFLRYTNINLCIKEINQAYTSTNC